ncbi:MAG TPA: ADP-ribosylglycohydrolase family protein [Chloroflexi bacterium]|nr:ADP-ribosylglycohydrolase family protein [Chloroflexota bacterium]
MSKLPHDYDNRVYAGWLGKCIGVRFGAPLEGWTYREILDTLGEVTDYLPLPPGKLFKPDDDTALPMLLIQALADYGPKVTAVQLGETWLNYLADQRGTLWWGGYGVSTEHTAYLNLASDVPAPLSGSIAMNGAALAEQIGGQIFSDIWGLVAPNNPELAADYAAKASSVSHDGNGIYGGMFIAGLMSAAFGESAPHKLLEIGLSLIPAESEYARVVTAVHDFHRQNPNNWREAYQFIHDNFGYDRYPGEVHIIPNAGIVVMSLLYGKGSFSRTIQIANMGGWDTDCNVGNVGAIMGVAVGLDGIESKWREPMDDLLVAAGLIGSRNLWTIPACADLFCRLGREIAGEQAATSPRYHFRYPGSTQGLQTRGDKGRIMAVREVDGHFGKLSAGCLRITVRKLNKKGEVRLFARTHVRPDELSANYYGASFSPQIYPGQTMRARLFLPDDAPADLRAGLYVHDGNCGDNQQAAAQPLTPGEWHDLSFQIPTLHNALLSEAGIVLRNLGAPWTGNVFLEWLDWDGPPSFSNDFALERPEYGSISQWTVLRGYWRLEDGAYHGSGAGINESYMGDVAWRDYEVTVRLRPLLGQHHLVLARVQGARRSYAAGLGPDGQLVLYKNDRGYRLVTAIPFPWRHNQSYTLTLRVQGSQLTVTVGNVHINWIDDDPWLNGQIGFANFAGGRTAYERLAIRE